MTPLRFFSLSGVLLLAMGCSKEKSFTEPAIPMAGIHFLNAVPDTGQVDFRVVDIVSSAGLFDANYRTGNMFYTGIEAGTRDVRVFLSSANPAISSQILWDTTYAFSATTNYSFIYAGFSRTGQTPAKAVWVVADNATAPGANQIGLRIINAGAGMGNLAINVTHHATDTLPDTPFMANVAYGAVGTYVNLPVDAVAADSSRVVVTATGTKTPVLLTVKLPTGVAGSPGVDPIAGARIAGSVMSAVIVPPSVAGSQAPQTAAFLVPTAVFFVDKRP